VDTTEKSAEEPATVKAAEAGDAYIRPPQPKKKRRKSTKKMELDDLKREVEMVGTVGLFSPILKKITQLVIKDFL